MKFLIKLFSPIFFFGMTQICTAQYGIAELDTSLNKLKTAIANRNLALIKIYNQLKNRKADQRRLCEVNQSAIDMNAYLVVNPITDSISISNLYGKYVSLAIELQKALITIEKQTRWKKKVKLVELMLQLERCQNRISISKNNYNDVCIRLKKEHLFFGDGYIEDAVKVEYN